MKFDKLQDKHCENIIKFLMQKKKSFILWCKIDEVSFDPPLPASILQDFRPISPFVLAGYTFESLALTERGISFEAGFGSENIGSIVEMDLSSILQIAITVGEKESVIFVRLDSKKIFVEESLEEEEMKRSMEAILSNPHNKQYL
ncbi:hypothetical protein [Helicobacter mustelae]|uniref:Putative hypothteical protein n=1 Tax=Helicobacter mustelae (strain ATCC 43772 / CCUG 25715 / CIP 103759 / LMG 18044 / NCTC 12198 / R85-136P) TaxID=679897 RepID=D3UHY1_HELM1|nr:hypothetical protein [Helicobacter mustelae]CBG40104.1 putative hypothteical protein [Helicobacter mustelae 12198]SQH71618.1 Uncharacterised protein [Helicobacter mustelae]STP12743.1 Uncharacterised protein [Helicobacter mustelae]